MILNFTIKIYKSNMPGSRLSLYSVVQSLSSGNKKNQKIETLRKCEADRRNREEFGRLFE